MATGLARMSYRDLQMELRRRQRSVQTLERKRARLAAKLRQLDTQIEMMGGHANGRAGGGGGGGRRPRNEMTLIDSLAKALHGRTMSVTDAADAVQRNGYKTNSNNFRTQVNIALIKSGKFKRVGRGQYTAK